MRAILLFLMAGVAPSYAQSKEGPCAKEMTAYQASPDTTNLNNLNKCLNTKSSPAPSQPSPSIEAKPTLKFKFNPEPRYQTYQRPPEFGPGIYFKDREYFPG